MADERHREDDRHISIHTGPCVLDDMVAVTETCIHAGSGMASARTRPVDIEATAAKLRSWGATHKARLNMIFLPFGSGCRVMIFPGSIKLRCLEDVKTPEDRFEAISAVMEVLAEGLVCSDGS